MGNNNKIFVQTYLIITTLIATGIVLSIGMNMFDNGFAAESKKIEIINKTPEKLIFQEGKNRQDVKIVVEPPKEIDAASGGGFSVAQGDSLKNYHLNVKYYVGSSGSSDTVGLGFKGDNWSSLDCFGDVPDSISGSYSGCHSGTITYTFEAKS